MRSGGAWTKTGGGLGPPGPIAGYGTDGTPIPVVTETKFWGLVFDRKLSFAAHIKYLKDRCLKALNLLRIV